MPFFSRMQGMNFNLKYVQDEERKFDDVLQSISNIINGSNTSKARRASISDGSVHNVRDKGNAERNDVLQSISNVINGSNTSKARRASISDGSVHNVRDQGNAERNDALQSISNV